MATQFNAEDLALIRSECAAAISAAALATAAMLFGPANGGAVRISAGGVRTEYAAAGDTDAQRGTAILAAQTAAAAGDTIYVYGNCSIGTALGKDLVNWWFTPGITITSTGTVTCINDGGAAMVFSVFGGARFVTTNANCINAGHASTIITIDCQRAQAVGASKTAVYASAGRINIKASDAIKSNSYDCVWAETAGYINFETVFLDAGDSPFECTNGAVVVGKAHYARGAQCTCAGSGYVAVELGELIGTDQASPTPVIDASCNGYIKCPHIVGVVTCGSSTPFTIIGATIDSRSAAGAPTIYLAESGLILQDCNLLTHSSETNSIGTSGGSHTLGVVGSLKYNKAVSGSVTLDWAKARADNRDGAALPTAAQNAAALLDLASGVETNLTPRECLRLVASALVGKVSGAGTGTEVFRNARADDKNRITATVDDDGNRTAITLDLT